MTTAPRFSVVVPAYNEAAGIGHTLESLHQQDFAGAYEILVVDNNSTDDTAAVARSHGVRVLHEARPGVCAARQCGTAAARGSIVVSTDADTVHPRDWLTRIDAAFATYPDAVAVAGPCHYQDPPWWAAAFPPLGFAAVAAVHAATGHLGYLTATNVAFRRASFPGYDTSLAQGGDEVDLLRRLRSWGPIVWLGDNPVLTSSRRMDQGLGYTLVVSFGYHYAWSYLRARRSGRGGPRVAPAIRAAHAGAVRRRRVRWRAGLLGALAGLLALHRARTGCRRLVRPGAVGSVR